MENIEYVLPGEIEKRSFTIAGIAVDRGKNSKKHQG